MRIGFDARGNPARQVAWYLWYQVYNRSGEPVYCTPEFELVTRNPPGSYLDEPQPYIFDQIRRFEVEAQVTGQLEHPGIVPVHDLAFNEEGQPFYVMKFVQGRTLQKVIEEFHEAKRKGTLKDTEEVEELLRPLGFRHRNARLQTAARACSGGVPRSMNDAWFGVVP